jgi:hypothetical protein
MTIGSFELPDARKQMWHVSVASKFELLPHLDGHGVEGRVRRGLHLDTRLESPFSISTS